MREQAHCGSVRRVEGVGRFGVVAGLVGLMVALQGPRQRVGRRGVWLGHSGQGHAHHLDGFAKSANLEIAVGHPPQCGRVGTRIFNHSRKCLLALAELKETPQQDAVVAERDRVGSALPDRVLVEGSGRYRDPRRRLPGWRPAATPHRQGRTMSCMGQRREQPAQSKRAWATCASLAIMMRLTNVPADRATARGACYFRFRRIAMAPRPPTPSHAITAVAGSGTTIVENVRLSIAR